MINFYSKYDIFVEVGLRENNVFIGKREYKSMFDTKNAVVKFIQFLIDIYGMFDDYKERKISICIYENFSEDIFEVKKKLIVDTYIGYGEAFTIEKVFENTKESV